MPKPQPKLKCPHKWNDLAVINYPPETSVICDRCGKYLLRGQPQSKIEWEREFRKKWLKIVDLIANARGIVDLVKAEKMGKDLIQKARWEEKERTLKLLGELEGEIKWMKKDRSSFVVGESLEEVVSYNKAVTEFNSKLAKLKKEI